MFNDERGRKAIKPSQVDMRTTEEIAEDDDEECSSDVRRRGGIADHLDIDWDKLD